jgi:cleavage and polyadenylation specificity factor subunit 1
MHTDAGPILTEWIEDYNAEGTLPTRTMKQGKAYSHVRYDTSLNLLLAAASHPSKFKLFDEDGNSAWEPEGKYFYPSPYDTFIIKFILGPDISEPQQTCSSLELVSPVDGFVIDG